MEDLLQRFSKFSVCKAAERGDAEMMFRNTDIERIASFSSVENPASRKIMEKAGMHYEGNRFSQKIHKL